MRIHNDSWGVSFNRSAYRIISDQVDEFVHEHPDMLVCLAAGNGGTAAKPRNAKPGFVGLQSLDAPATAKNALTVGASRTDRTGVETPERTWSRWDAACFPTPPIANELVSGDPESMAAFSARGPTDEQIRVKPDIVAPGTYVLSTRASTASPPRSVPYPANPAYVYCSGTSMATPIVSGCAALVRQYLVEERNHLPSAALLKAVLINGAQWMTGQDARADNLKEPNCHQGFGRISLQSSIPTSAGPSLRLEFSDNWRDDRFSLKDFGDARQFVFSVDQRSWLRVCLAWSDPPARGVQNALALLLEDKLNKQKWIGNEYWSLAFGADADLGNNVQVIRLESAPAGPYVLQVTAQGLMKQPQAFALVVTTGSLTSSPLTALDPP